MVLSKKTETLNMLRDQLKRLEQAHKESGLEAAEFYIAQLKEALRQPHHWELWRGLYGPNGKGPMIDDLINTSKIIKKLKEGSE